MTVFLATQARSRLGWAASWVSDHPVMPVKAAVIQSNCNGPPRGGCLSQSLSIKLHGPRQALTWCPLSQLLQLLKQQQQRLPCPMQAFKRNQSCLLPALRCSPGA